jgi:hypothetical protein
MDIQLDTAPGARMEARNFPVALGWLRIAMRTVPMDSVCA